MEPETTKIEIIHSNPPFFGGLEKGVERNE